MTDTLYREFVDQSQIDAEYNPSIHLRDPAAEMRHFADRARLARASLRGVLDVPYGPTLAETLDIFPAAQPGAPVFVFLHGGYWRALSSKDFSGVALGPQALGVTTVVVNYALCPWVSIDEITRQCRAAVAWVLRHIGEHGGDASRVALGGHSAGAHLTAMCLQTRWATDYGLAAEPIKAALLVSGLYDLAPLRYSYLQPKIQLGDGVIQRNSPAFSVRPCSTPLWVAWGTTESAEFARQSKLYHEAWQGAGNRSELSPIAEANHFSAIHGFDQADGALAQWLAQQLGESG